MAFNSPTQECLSESNLSASHLTLSSL